MTLAEAIARATRDGLTVVFEPGHNGDPSCWVGRAEWGGTKHLHVKSCTAAMQPARVTDGRFAEYVEQAAFNYKRDGM